MEEQLAYEDFCADVRYNKYSKSQKQENYGRFWRVLNVYYLLMPV